MPELHLRLSKITSYYVLEAQTDVARFQSKTRLPIRIQEYLSNDVAKMLLAYFAVIFLNHLAREDVQNVMLCHGAKRYNYLSQFLDTMVAYIGQNYEAYNSTVAFMNRFKSIDSVITPSYHPSESRTSYRNAPRVHNLQSAHVLVEDYRKQNPADELLEDDQQSYYEPQSVSDDGENEDAQQLPDHTEMYD